MKISLNWLKDFVDIPAEATNNPQKFGELFTIRTAEVEGVEDLAKAYENMVIGKINKIEKHPDADKLQVTQTDVGAKNKTGEEQIVCGAANIKEGMLVPVALPGSFVRWHGEGDLVELKEAKIRGVKSVGMICAGEEIGLEPNPEGIVDLSHLDAKPGTPLAEALKLDDVVIEIDNKSLTHRPDLWGHYGIAREVAAIFNTKLKPMEPKIGFPAKGETPDIKVEDKQLCPRYLGVIIKNVKVAQSPDWMKSRLLATGHRPISNIVDITNYVMTELGQPLHAFDKNYIKGGIVVRHAQKDEKITTLDGKERKLDEEMLVIADHEKPVALAGIMGGENSEINENTTEIIIESANFDAQNVRKTSSKLALRTESLQRFEKSLDPALAELAIKRVCELVLQLCPNAEIAGPLVDVNNADQKEIRVHLDAEKVSSKIGVEMSVDECKKLLERLEFKVEKKSDTQLTVTVPSFRATRDVDIHDDLVEEIVRLYGYENVPAIMPHLPINVPKRNKERTLKHQAREILSYGLGMAEVYNYSFYGEDEMTKSLLDNEKKHILIDNALSQDQTHLRVSLVPNLLNNVADNLRYFDEFKLYEIGRTYIDEGDYFPLEEKWIGAAVVSKTAKDGYYEAKRVCEEFVHKFIKREVTFEQPKKVPPYVHPSRCAVVHIDGEPFGLVFEVHPLVLKNYDIKAQTGMFELNFTHLCELEEKVISYQKLPKFPGIEIDVSVLIDKTRTVGELKKSIQQADDVLIQEVRLFDIYEGEGIEEDKKALAFKILLQAEDRTLTDEEMAKVQKKIFEILQKKGGVIRGI